MLLPRLAGALLVSLLTTQAFAAQVAAPSPEQQQKLNALRTAAASDDRPAACKAIMEMVALGESARPQLIVSLRATLTRDRGLLEENLRKVAAGGDLKALEATITAQQVAAIAKIEKLATAADTNQARAEYTKLNASIKRVNELYAARTLLLDIMQIRPTLLGVWKDLGAKTTPNPIDPAAEAKLSESVEKALGPHAAIVKALQANPTVWSNPSPAGAEQAGLLNYRLRRRADLYNRSLANLVDKNEADLLAQINIYRDVLGLPPVELDARLVQAARRHSKEMVEMKYFSPTSPNEPTKDSMARRKNAGYDGEGFWSEALGRGTTTGVQTFWAMFDQPPYHKGMTALSATSIGIGRWNNYWTVEIGESKRLMLANEEEKSKALVQGENVPPQSPVASARGNGGSGAAPGDDGRITDPRQIRPRAPNGAGSVPSIPAIPGIGGF
jgi:uncharacterized protein YkwD